MKRFSRIFSVMTALAISFALAAVAGAEIGSIQKKDPGSIQKSPGQIVPVRHEFKVERVFISKADSPGVPYTGIISVGGNYLLNCEISHIASVANSAPVTAYVIYKVDGQIELDLSGGFTWNEKKNFPAPLSPNANAKVFAAGSHSYECSIQDFKQNVPSNHDPVPDTDLSNNTKSMTYTVQKVLKPATGTLQKMGPIQNKQ